MGLPLFEIARLVDGNLTGNEDLVIEGAATLSVARPGEITLADHSKLAAQLSRCEASAVIVPGSFQPTYRPYITVSDVHAAAGNAPPLWQTPHAIAMRWNQPSGLRRSDGKARRRRSSACASVHRCGCRDR